VDSVEFKLHKDNVKPRTRPPIETNGAGRPVKMRKTALGTGTIVGKPAIG
jgi:hypothetical protein